MNTMILVGIGLIWSGISGAIGWVVKWHQDEGRYIRDTVVRIERDDAHKLIAHLKTDYETLRQERDRLATKNAALDKQCKDVIARNVVLVAQVEDRNEAIAALQAQLVVAEAAQSKPDEAVYFVAPDAQEKIGGAKPKRPRATKVKAE